MNTLKQQLRDDVGGYLLVNRRHEVVHPMSENMLASAQDIIGDLWAGLERIICKPVADQVPRAAQARIA